MPIPLRRLFGGAPREDRWRDEAARMAERQIRRRGVRDERVLDAMATTPRHRFIPPGKRSQAYGDHPVKIGLGQTISQPYIVALTLEALELKGEESVLEIGTGSGYQTALLLRLARRVVTVERHGELLERAAESLRELGCEGFETVTGDGTLGWPDGAPYDAIVVTAAGPDVPGPLREQLADGGRLVMPVGDRAEQDLLRVERRGEEFLTVNLCACRFVPLIGAHGFPS